MTSVRILRLLGASLCLTVAVSCTRPKEDTSKINIAMPQTMRSEKLSSMDTSTTDQVLMHVVINVSGSGMPDIVANYDADENARIPVPSSISLDVPMGDNRLVQVLGVYGSWSDSHTLNIYYGENPPQTFSKASESVSITLVAQNTAATEQGHISGRYLSDATTGPSGIIETKFLPPTGTRAMTIERNPIVSGWFSLFSLKGVNFSYVYIGDGSGSGVPLQGFDKIDLSAFTTSNSVMKIKTGPYYDVYCQKSGSSCNTGEWTVYSSVGETYVLGYFGPGAGSNVVCSTATAVSFPNTNSYGGGKYATCTLPVSTPQASCAGYLSYSPSYSSATLEPGQIASSGGAAACPASGTNFVNYIMFDPNNLKNGGGDSFGGFNVPFRKILQPGGGGASYYTDLAVQATPTGLQLSWSTLPGLKQTDISSFDVFLLKDKTSVNYKADHGVDCARLQSLGFGLSTNIPYVEGTTAYSYTLAAQSSTDLSSYANAVVAICPAVSPGRYVGSLYMDSLSGWTQMGLPQPPTGINVGIYKSIAQNLCVPVDVNLSSGSTSGLYIASAIDVAISQVNGSNVALNRTADAQMYSDAACTTLLPSPSGAPNNGILSWAAGDMMYSKRFYYKPLTTSQTGVTLTASASGLTSGTASVNWALATSPHHFDLQVISSYASMNAYGVQIPANVCTPMDIVSFDVSGRLTTQSIPSLNIQASAPTSLDNTAIGFYTDASCSASLNYASSVWMTSIPTNNFHTIVYVKTVSSLPNLKISANYSTVSGYVYANVVPLADHLALTSPNFSPSGGSIFASDCIPGFNVSSVDGSANPTPVLATSTTPLLFSLNMMQVTSSSSLTGNFYLGGACSGTPTNLPYGGSIAQGSSSANMGYFQINSGSLASVSSWPTSIYLGFDHMHGLDGFLYSPMANQGLSLNVSWDPGVMVGTLVDWFAPDAIVNAVSSWPHKNGFNAGSTISHTGSSNYSTATAVFDSSLGQNTYAVRNMSTDYEYFTMGLTTFPNTIAMLVKLPTQGSYKKVFTLAGTPGGNIVVVGTDSGGYWSVNSMAGSVTPATGWQVLFLTVSASSTSLYVNGNTSTATSSATGSFSSATNLYLGSNAANDTGQVLYNTAEVLRFNNMLSAAQMSQIYAYFKAKYPAAGLP